jgi:hypothetical protein
MANSEKTPGGPDRTSRSKVIFGVAVSFLIVMNLVVLAAAYPETMAIDSGCCGNRPLARDFSAFYIGAWRLINNPGQVYNASYVNDGEYHVLPQPEAYKYLPSFLLLATPFLSLSYQNALTAFDVFQFLLLPLIAWLIYELTKDKGITAAVVVAMIALLLPSPTPQWSLSVAYYWQWAEGQSKVLETFLLVLSFYFGKSGRPYLSGITLGISAFDPRFALVSLPLFIMYNRSKLSGAFLSGTVTLLLTNASLLIPGMGSGFLNMLFGPGLSTPLYYYALIPLLTVVALTLLNLDEVLSSLKVHIGGKRAPSGV